MSEGYKITELGAIPSGWEIASIGNIATVVRGASPRPKGDPRYYGGSVPRLMGQDVTRDGKYVTPTIDFLTEEGAKRSRFMDAGTLVMICSGDVGVPSILAVDACVHDGFLAFPEISDTCDKEYLYYVFDSLRLDFDKSATHGGVFTNLTTSIIKDFKIALPSLAEQKKIAEILSTVDEKIDVIDAQIIQTQELKKGLMQQLLSKGIGHTQFKKSTLGEIPVSWEVLEFESLLSNHKNALCYGILQPGDDVEVGVPMLRTVDLEEVGLSGTKILKVSEAISNTSTKTVLEGGEVLLSVMGTLGRTVVVPPTWRGWNVNRALAVIRLNNLVINEFICHYFRSSIFIAVIEKQALGSAQMRINLNDLKTYLIPVPPIDEQQRISKIINTVDEKLAVLKAKKGTYQKLKKGLMQHLLFGKIRVNHLIQNPMAV